MQTFDYEQVSTKMEQLKVVFEDFAKRLDTMDKKYTEEIAVSSDSALYGSKADKVISHWNHFGCSFSYFDKDFFEGMFGNFVFPDMTTPKWESVKWLQQEFMQWFNAERLKTLITFPVESVTLLYKDGHFEDEEMANFDK